MSLSILPLFAAMVAVIELVHLLRPVEAFRRMGASARRARRFVMRRGSDRWKERAMRGHSWRLFVQSMKAGGLLAVIVVPLAIVLLLDAPLSLGVLEALTSWRTRIALAFLTLAYGLVRYVVARTIQRR